MSEEVIAHLRQLAELHEQGILTDDEFAAQKAKLLAEPPGRSCWAWAQQLR